MENPSNPDAGGSGYASDFSPEDMAAIALGCIQSKKGVDPVVLAVEESTLLADFFVIASVDSTRQARALGQQILSIFKQRGVLPVGVEGMEEGWWVLLDFGDVVIHVLQRDARSYYDLDSYWGDCPVVELEPIMPAA